MKRILVISSNYPSEYNPQVGTFVYKLVQEFVKEKNEVTVISPRKFFFGKKKKTSYGSEKANIYRPVKLTFSNRKIGFINTFHLTSYFQSRVLKKTIEKINWSPQVIYCHFIVSGLNYFQAFSNSKQPLFIAVGEYHNIDTIRKNYSSEYYFNFLNQVQGFIAVSHQIEEKLITLGVPKSKIIVEPNSTDLRIFKPRNKVQLRRKLGLPSDKKILLFVGRFLENKGPLRVQEALDSVGINVVAVFIGKGPQQIDHPKVVFAGAVEHDKVAEYMAAADVFVLPTLHEGSSNVIIEAMASGLPIVSSDIPEIRTQCNSDFAILVNPMDVSEISNALNAILESDELRLKMSRNALQVSKTFDINLRAKRILKFIDEHSA